MGMSKKTENISFRQTPEEKALLIEMAKEMETTPGSLASIIISRFIKARRKHGSRLVWPPEFNYYPANIKSAQEQTTLSSPSSDSVP